MSLFGSLGTAINGMSVQAKKIRTISGNISNAETPGYKTRETTFQSQVLSGKGKSNGACGVTSSTRTNIAQQGNIRITENKGDLAIDGNGFFLVKSSSNRESPLGAVRTAAFRQDKDGHLVNDAGYYLQGQRLGKSAEAPNASNLESVQIPTDITIETSKITLGTLLPEKPTNDDEIKDAVQFYDAKGNEHSLTVTYTYTDDADGNENPGWLVSVDVDKLARDPALATSTSAGITVDAPESYLDLSGDEPAWKYVDGATGGAAGAKSAPIQKLSVRWENKGAVDTINLDLSKIRASSTTVPGEQTTATQDGGIREVYDWSVEQDGKVGLTFKDGSLYQLYQLPLATCVNFNGLTEKSNGVYFANADSGEFIINNPEQNGLGIILPGAQEASTTDIAKELSDMIATQYAYAANSKVIGTISEMLDTLMRL
ncbi:MAG: flagellar hook-basal body complex protein [Holosporales bacterium]|jgi:flagellar hook protein FlgE|nr:flagellar hook-basal body complex protein [Holosporales bacterium]